MLARVGASDRTPRERLVAPARIRRVLARASVPTCGTCKWRKLRTSRGATPLRKSEKRGGASRPWIAQMARRPTTKVERRVLVSAEGSWRAHTFGALLVR